MSHGLTLRGRLLLSAIVACGAGCAALAGVGDFDEAPCEGPCGDAALDTALDTATTDSSAEVPPDTGVDTASDGADGPPEAPDAMDAADVTDATDARDADASDATDVSDTADADDAGPCPGTVGKMVSIVTFSIDATEVTNAQYAAFLSTSPSTAGQPAVCAWNTSYAPTGTTWPVTSAPGCNLPVVGVDWCDAVAYCKWAGKRLCGSPTTGPAPYASPTVPGLDAWYNACSSGGATTYPYGSTYAAARCVDKTYETPAPLGPKVVGTATACQSPTTPYKGIMDMAGNVGEWEDSCDKSTGAGDNCRIRGGAFNDDSTHATCPALVQKARSFAAVDVGFRCCSL